MTQAELAEFIAEVKAAHAAMDGKGPGTPEWDTWFGDLGIKKRWTSRPCGLTRAGLLAVVEQAMFGGIPVIGSLEMTRPDLNEPGVSGPDLPEWDPDTEGLAEKEEAGA